MAVSEFAQKYYDKMFPGGEPSLARTDPEFVERFKNFAFDEVINQEGVGLDNKTRFLAILATLLGCQGLDEFRVMTEAALNFGVTPVEIKETVYQATAYLGIGRVYPFLNAVNEVFRAQGVELPLEGQSTTTTENRREKGTQAQVDIFGEQMRDFWKNGHINLWLAGNCFGDYYTFCFIAAQGGCEPQLIAHAAGNMNLGNDRDFLIAVVSQCVPYIGYPRSLNAITCINKAYENINQKG